MSNNLGRAAACRARQVLVWVARSWMTIPIILGIALAAWIGDARSEAFPDAVRGIWAEPDCSSGQRVKIVNAMGIMDFVPSGENINLQVSVFTTVPHLGPDGVVQARVVNPNTKQEFAIELAIEDGRLNGEMEYCSEAPPAVQWIYGEAIAGFDGAGGALELCTRTGGAPCLKTLFEFVDVTGDGSLSAAEVARLLRIAGFFAGYFSKPEALVSSRQVLVPTALAGAVGAIAAAAVIASMDYDDNGRLSVDELLQDRGEGVGLEAAASALEPAAAQAVLQSIGAAVPGIVQMLSSFH
jgi:hypothetical protein